MKLTTTLVALLLLLSATYLQGQAYDIKEVSLTNSPIALQEVGEQLKHEKIEWFADKRRFLWVANVEKKDRTETVIRTIGYEDTTNVVLTVKTAKKQTLQIKSLLALPASRMFLYGEYYCTKNPTKKLYNWYAICDNNGQIIVQKKTKYKGYQTACLMNGKEIGLLYNPIKKDTFTNRPVVEVLNWETFKIDRSIALEMKKNQAAFVNSVVFDEEDYFLAFGRYTAVLHEDTSIISLGFFDKFDKEGKYVNSFLEEGYDYNFKFNEKVLPINPIPHPNSYIIDVPYRATKNDQGSRKISIMSFDDWGKIIEITYVGNHSETVVCVSSDYINMLFGGSYLDAKGIKQPNLDVRDPMGDNVSFFQGGYSITIDVSNSYNRVDRKILQPYFDANSFYEGSVILMKNTDQKEEGNDMEVDVVIRYKPQDKINAIGHLVMLKLIYLDNEDYWDRY